MRDTDRASFFLPIQQGFLILILALCLGAAGAAAFETRWVILSLILGVGIGVLLDPMIGFIHRRLHLPKALGAGVCFVLALGTISGFLYLFGSTLIAQVTPLTTRLPELLGTARENLSKLVARVPWAHVEIPQFHMPSNWSSTGGALLRGLALGAEAVTGLVFSLVVGLYFAIDPASYLKGFLSVFPSRLREEVSSVMRESGVALRHWFTAQLLAMFILGTITSLGLKLIGVNYWLSFGLLTMLFSIVPVVGPLASFIVTSVLTLGGQPDKIWWVLGLNLLIHRIEGDLIIPIVMKKRAELPPVHLMTLILIMGKLFGVVGVLMAPPLLTVFRTIYLRVYVPRMDVKVNNLEDKLERAA